MEVENTLSDLLRVFVIQQRNAMELWNKISSALTTDSQNVLAEITDSSTGETFKVSIPSIRAMQNDIVRLNQNFKSMSGLDNNATIQTPDGDFKRVIISSLFKEADSLQQITIPERFKSKTNWFFENFLSPLLYIEFDYTGVISNNTKMVESTRLILSLDTDGKREWFSQYNKTNEIDYSRFVQDMQSQSVDYIVDINILPIAIRENIYYGDFGVLNIYDDTQTVNINGVDETVTRKKYELDTLRYSSKLTSLSFTETLKVGDQFIVNKNNKNTKYEITEIDTARNTVVLKLVEGYDAIGIGGAILSLFSSKFTRTVVDVPVDFDKFVVLFLRPIDENSNIVSNFYSPGTAFYTNDLKISLGSGLEQTLEEYYRAQVTDFGQILLGLAKDASPPAIFGQVPIAPTISADNFKVVIVNKHLTEKKEVKDLQKYQNEKNNLQSEVSELDSAIAELRNRLITKNYNSTIERDSDQTALTTLETKRENKKSTLNSLITKINTIATNETINVKPKYRARGFWPIPVPESTIRTGDQEIIQFIIEYRYLNKDGDANPVEKIDFKDNDAVIKKGSFSEWTQIKSPIRQKVYDEETDSYIWSDENVEDGEAININQLDIAINAGEKIQVRIKSVSEAGYPNNPLISDWSDIVDINFPDSLSNDTTAQDIIEQSQKELVKVQLDEELNSLGIKKHLNDSFPSNGREFKHQLKNIDSGYVDSSQNPIDAFTKMAELITTVGQLSSSLQGNVEDYACYILDEFGNKFDIKVGFKNEIFSGYYRDIVENQTIKQGAIVTRIYKLVIENKAQSNLILQSLNAGDSTQVADITLVNGIDFNYGIVPIGVQNQITHANQLKGQIVYNRFVSIFDTPLFGGNSNVGLFNIGVNNVDCVVENSEFASPMSLDPLFLYVHQDHPLVSAAVFTGTDIELPISLGLTNIQNEYDINTKISFSENDKYLIGEKSIGAFLYMLSSDANNTNLRVDGETIFSNKQITANGGKIEIQIVFQYRMTDYYGDTSVTAGIGRIGGVGNLTNLTLGKTIGIDFTTKFGGQQGFDIAFIAKYAPDGVSVSNILGAP
jgi:hypothetical protein